MNCHSQTDDGGGRGFGEIAHGEVGQGQRPLLTTLSPLLPSRSDGSPRIFPRDDGARRYRCRRVRWRWDSSTDTTVATTSISTTLTKDDLIQQGDGICAEVNAAVGTVESSSSDDATKLSQEADLYSGMVERLKGLGTPDDSTGLDSVYNAGDDLVQAQKDAQLAAERGDNAGVASAQSDAAAALGSFQDAASSYGFKECGKAAVAPQGTTTTAPAAPTSPSTTTPAAPVTPAAPAPAPAPAPAAPTGGGTPGGASPGGTGGGAPAAGPAGVAAAASGRLVAAQPGSVGRRRLRPCAVELRVGAARLDQLLVGAFLGDPAALQNDDLAGAADSREAVGDDDRRAADQQPLEARARSPSRCGRRRSRSPRRGSGSGARPAAPGRRPRAGAGRRRAGRPVRRPRSRCPRAGRR